MPNLSWDEFIGQERLKNRLTLAINSAVHRVSPLPPTLLIGPPGCGKTTFARLIAEAMSLRMEERIAPIPTRLMRMLVSDNDFYLLFIDEIHRMTRSEQEQLLPLLSEGYWQDDRGRRIENRYVSIVGATTEADKIIRPLYSRFSIKPPFDAYDDDQMTQIVKNMVHREGLAVDDEWAAAIGRASLGLPRNARSLVEAARDLHLSNDQIPDVDEVLSVARITDTGLSADHIRYLNMLTVTGGSAGLDTMRQLLGIPSGHVEMIEIDLIKQGLLERTRSGREITPMGMRTARLKEDT